MNKTTKMVKDNTRCARSLWGTLSKSAVRKLEELTVRHLLSVSAGELLRLEGTWYITHAGLLSIAHRRKCAGITTTIVESLCEPTIHRWVVRAIAFKSRQSPGFVGYGDADTSNVSPLVRGAEMRVAETRAVNRALRKAYGIGLCSVEELGYVAPASPAPRSFEPHSNAGNGNGFRPNEPRLRDRLCLLIRQHNLDPTLVKAYAADFCGTAVLKDAARELVESFIAHLATAAKEDRDALICKLNSYIQPKEVRP